MHNTTIAYTANSIYTGMHLLQHHAMVCSNGIITDVLPKVTLPNDGSLTIVDFGDATIIPPFADLQLYGAEGKLLAVTPTAATVEAIANYSVRGGAYWCMPTVATNTYEVIYACIDAIKAYWQQGGKHVLGLHVEGPWISIEKRGAHVAALIHTPTIKQVTELLQYGKGVIKMITLAPECCDDTIIQYIKQQGIIVSAGHSNATYEVATHCFDNGVQAATHLYNAMSAFEHRNPGMVGAILNHNSVKASIIPDGYHVSWPAIQLALRQMNDRLFAITDAVTTTSEGYYQHMLDGDKYVANGTLSGSALTMQKALYNLIHFAGVPFVQAIDMCSIIPLRLMHKIDEVGLLKKSYPAQAIVLDNGYNIIGNIGL
mgnify:CR=1 FL=1